MSTREAAPGQSVVLTWSGPERSDFSPSRPSDLIGLYAIDDPRSSRLWDFDPELGTGPSTKIKAPDKPGAYEIRYLMNGEYVLTTTTLTVR